MGEVLGTRDCPQLSAVVIIIGGRGRLVQRLPKVEYSSSSTSCSRENAQDLLSKFKLISPILFCRFFLEHSSAVH